MPKTINPIIYKNKTIHYMDYSNCSKQELIKRAEEVMAWMATQPKKSLLTISDVTNQHFDNDSLEAFKKLAAHNEAYEKHGAVIGIVGMLKIAYSAVMAFSKRKMPTFPTKEEAMEWLISQP